MNKWSDTTLGAVTDIRVSNVDKKTLFGERPVHLCNYMDVYSTNSVTPERELMPASATEPEFQRFKLFPGDVVVTKDSESPDDIAVPTHIEPGIGEDVVCGYHLAILRPKSGLNGKFLSYLLRLPEVNLHFARSATGSTRFGLSLKALHDAPLRIPESELEQQSIAEVLSALDEQIDATENEKSKLEQVVIAVFDDAFGQAIAENLTCQALKRGRLNPGWIRIPLLAATKAILDFRGRTPLKLGMQWGGGTIQALSANNVEMGRVNFEKETYLGSEMLYKKWMTQGDCSINDILMTLEAPLGNVALVPDDRKYILSQRVILLKPDTEIIDGRYLSLYLRWRWFQQLLSEESTGTTATGIQRKKLEKLPVLVPSHEQCKKTTEFLFNLIDQMSGLEAEVSKLKLLKKSLMHDLLTGKTKVLL